MRRTTGSSRRAARGFTLIEVVVALVVMAVMSVMAWRAVSTLTTSREHNEIAMDRAERLQTLIRQWELDVREVQSSDVFPALSFDGSTLRLTRRRDSGMQLVAWQLREGRLARWESPTLTTADAMRDAWFRSQQLNVNDLRELPGLDRVAGLQMYFFQSGAWANAQSSLDKDPNAQAPDSIPEGVRLRVQFGEDSGYRGELVREVAVEVGK